MREAFGAAAVLAVAAMAMATASQGAQRSSSPLVLGLDHLPLAVTDLAAAAERYGHLGFTLKQGRRHENGIFLPGSRQMVQGRRIIGATLRARDLKSLQGALAKGPWNVPPIAQTRHGASVFLPPGMAHGLWLEFRQER